jgi:hypothetical protein
MSEHEDRQRLKALFDEAFSREGGERDMLLEKIVDGIMKISRGPSSLEYSDPLPSDQSEHRRPMLEKVVQVSSGNKMILRLPEKHVKATKKATAKAAKKNA